MMFLRQPQSSPAQIVTPAKAGVHPSAESVSTWTPAFAGVTYRARPVSLPNLLLQPRPDLVVEVAGGLRAVLDVAQAVRIVGRHGDRRVGRQRLVHELVGAFDRVVVA